MQEQEKQNRKARQISNKKNTTDIAGLSSKLAQCTSRKPEECELFIVKVTLQEVLQNKEG